MDWDSVDWQNPVSDHPLNNGLVAWWLAGSPGAYGGNTWRDLTNKHIGTLTSSPTWQGPEGRPGGRAALDMNGSAYVNCTDKTDFTFGNGSSDSPFSFALWANVPSSGSNQRIVDKYDTSALQREWLFVYLSTGTLRFNTWDESADRQIGRDVTATDYRGSPHHYTMTYTGSGAESGITVFVDGVRVDDTSASSTPYTAMENTTGIMTMGGFAAQLNGWLDDFSLWKRNLTASEVLAVYQDSKHGYQKRLRSY